MKRTIICLLIVILLVGSCLMAVSAAGTGSLSATSASGYRGDTVTVAVNMNSNPGLITMKFQVSYSSNLTLVSVSNAGLLNGWTTPAPTISSPYTLRWADSLATANNTATGKLVTLTFKISENAPIGKETVTITFNESRDADGGKNTFSSTSATITVNCKHSYSDWTKVDDTNHKRTCSICSAPETAKHTWDNGTTLKQADCKEGGQVKYTCTTCQATKTVDTEKTTTHSYGAWTQISDTQHKRTCSVCSNPETANHTWDKGTVIKKADCKEGGQIKYTCTGCGTPRTEDTEKLTTHTYDHGCDTDCNVCSATRTTTHSYKTKWSKDKNEHWHECSECKDKKDVAAHTPGPEATEDKAQTCTECGYVIKAALGHKHDYAKTWTTDETGHWYACSGCEEKGSYADHDFENACDPDCSICGLTRETAHDFGETWESDEANHWHVCSGCGLKQDEAAHTPGAAATATKAQTCTDCGYEIAPALGGGKKDTDKTAIVPQNGGFPWGIIVVAVIIVGGVVAFVVIKKRRL